MPEPLQQNTLTVPCWLSVILFPGWYIFLEADQFLLE